MTLNKRWARWLSILLFTASVSRSGLALEAEELYASVGPSLVHLDCSWQRPDGKRFATRGTGFFVGGNGFVLTAKHLTPPADATSYTIYGQQCGDFGGKDFGELTVVEKSAAYDVAVLQLKAPKDRDTTMRLRLQPRPVKPGEAILAMGFPFERSDLELACGHIKLRHSEDTNLWLTDALVNPGDSGAPVFDRNGFVIGMIVGGVGTVSGWPSQGLNAGTSVLAVWEILPEGTRGSGPPRPTGPVQKPAKIIFTFPITLDAADMSKVSQGQTALVQLDARPGYRFESVLATTVINPRIELHPEAVQLSKDRKSILVALRGVGHSKQMTQDRLDAVITAKQILEGR